MLALTMVVFGALLVLRTPLAFSMIIASLVYIVASGVPLVIVAQKLINSLDSFVLLAVPLFLLSGSLMNSVGVTKRIFGFADHLLGPVPGGIAHANVLASLILAGSSGSATADIGGLGLMEMEAMNKRGFPKKFSIGITAASGLIGPIFPPSIPLIIYAAVAQVSGVEILLAGVVPGVLMAVSLSAYIYIVAKRRGLPRGERQPLRVVAAAFIAALPAILAPVILVGGLVSGLFTPTETAGVCVAYSALLGFAIYREAEPRHLLQSAIYTVETSGSVLFLLASGMLFGYVLTLSQVGILAAEFMLSLSSNPLVLLLIVNVFLLVVGCLIDPVPATLILVPILLPPLTKVGVDPTHFGIVLILNLVIGLLTPPVGIGLYVASAVAELSVEDTLRGIAPFIIPLLVALLVVTVFPGLSLYVPQLVFPAVSQ